MPPEGRGFSTCLICDQTGTLMPTLPRLIVIIRRLFKSKDLYLNLLKASQMCLSCTGRFFQLSEFNTIRESYLNKDVDEKVCHFCVTDDIMSGNVVKHAIEALKGTRWWEDYGAEIDCCFACYEFMKLYANLKATLDKQRLMFVSRIGKCHVKLKRCPDDDSDADSVIVLPPEPVEVQPEPTEESQADQNSNTEAQEQVVSIEEPSEIPGEAVTANVQSPAEVAAIEKNILPVKLEVPNPLPESIPTNDDMAADPEIPIKVEIPSSADNVKQEVSSNEIPGAEVEKAAEQTLPKRGRRSTILKRLNSDFEQSPDELVDKFTAIKNRRGKDRSNDLKELPRKRKSLGNIKTSDESEVALEKKRRHSVDLANIAPHCDVVMDVVESQPEVLPTASQTGESPIDPTQLDEIINILVKDVSKEEEAPKVPQTAENNQVVTVKSEIKTEESQLKIKLKPRYQNLHDKLQQAKGNKTNSKNSTKLLNYEEEAIIKAEKLLTKKYKTKEGSTKPKTHKKNLKKSNKPKSSKIKVQNDSEITEAAENNILAMEVIEDSISQMNSAPMLQNSENIDCTTNDGSLSFAAEQAQFDSINSIDELFPQLNGIASTENIFDDPIAYGAEVIISEIAPEEPLIPLQDDEPLPMALPQDSGRPTAEEIARFGIKACSVNIERLSPRQLQEQQERSPKSTGSPQQSRRSPSGKPAEPEIFTKSGRKCCKPKRLRDVMDESVEEVEPPQVKQKKKKPFTPKLLPGPEEKLRDEKISDVEYEPELSPKQKSKKKVKTPKPKKPEADVEAVKPPKLISSRKDKPLESKKPKTEKNKTEMDESKEDPEPITNQTNMYDEAPEYLIEELEFTGEHEFTEAYVELTDDIELPETIIEIPHPRFAESLSPPLTIRRADGVKTALALNSRTTAGCPLSITPFSAYDRTFQATTDIHFIDPKFRKDPELFYDDMPLTDVSWS